jgi:hypothetical protein
MPRYLNKIVIISLGVFMASCAHFDSQKNRSSYESMVWARLNEGTIIAQGSSLVNVRWMELSEEYFLERKALLGFEDSLTLEFQASQRPFVLVALQMKSGALFSPSDFKVFYQGLELVEKREVINVLELRSLYSFAHPFHRVFIYKTLAPAPMYDSQAKPTFSVWTPWGKLDQEQKR